MHHGRPSCEFCPQNSLTTSSCSLRLNFTLNADMTYRKCQTKTSRRRLWWLFFGQDLHTDVTFMISLALVPRESVKCKVQMSSLRRDKWWTGLLCRDKSRSCFTLDRSGISTAAVLFCSGFCLPRRQSICRQPLHRCSAHCFPHNRSPWRTFPKDEAPALKACYSSHLALSQFVIVKRRQKDLKLLEYELRIRDSFMSGFHKKISGFI